MEYKIKSWIPCEEDEPEIYATLKAARDDLQELAEMQPENRYEVHAVEDDENVECYLCGTKEKESVAHDTWTPSFWHDEFKLECGPTCPICSKRLQLDANKNPFLPVGG